MTRKIALIAYGTKQQIENYFTDNYNQMTKYAYIYHDQDEVEPHWHIYIYFKNATTFDRVKKKIHKYTNQNVLTEEVIDEKGLIAYFTHEGIKDKYQYSKESIIISSDFFKVENIWIEMYTDYIEKKKNVKEMIYKYGKDFVINIKNWRDIRAENRQEQLEKIIGENNEK